MVFITGECGVIFYNLFTSRKLYTSCSSASGNADLSIPQSLFFALKLEYECMIAFHSGIFKVSYGIATLI
jgi:hypothetical protein